MTGLRAVFVDVDGTIVDHDGHVPTSAIAAIRAARRAGHLVFLCTGRTSTELWPELTDIGFDGFVGAAGGYVEVGGQVLVHHGVPEASLRHALDFFAAHDTFTYLQANDAIHATPPARDQMRALITAATGIDPDAAGPGPFGFIERVRTHADVFAETITKVIFLQAPVPLTTIEAEFAGEFAVVPSSVRAFTGVSGEMSLPGVHKAAGLDAVVAHLGLDHAATIAVGDSHNDLEMLQHAALGIAMGNAVPELVAVADDVTGRVDEDGLHAAFVRHGLIAG